jgi:hypothetical protein
LFGLGNEEEDAEEDELSLDETSEGLREDERDRVPMAEAKKKKEICSYRSDPIGFRFRVSLKLQSW